MKEFESVAEAEAAEAWVQSAAKAVIGLNIATVPQVK